MMCDTLLAPPQTTAEHVMLFAKNSDRQRNEAQGVEYVPGRDYPADAVLDCTYVTIPQARETHAVMLCRPFWTWGAEMGANEHGVVVGNEGLHARIPAPQENALTGLDLVRLSLERASSAAEAVEVITTLLERHGQGGNCGHLTPAYYNNGFMVADASEAFVLETLGRDWILECLSDVRAMSNCYGIGRGAQRVSAGLAALIRDSGWSVDTQPSYAEVIMDPHREHIGSAGARRGRGTALLQSRAPRLDAADMMAMLRDHGTGDLHHSQWRTECADTHTLCMHAGIAERAGQTVGSLVSEIRPGDAVHWVTGTAAPCISIFKPVLLDVPLPQHGLRPTDRFDARTLWWRHEQLHRAAIFGGFAGFLADIRPQREALEADFRTRLTAVRNGGTNSDRARVVNDCWNVAHETEERWRATIVAAPPAGSPYISDWMRLNELAGVEAW